MLIPAHTLNEALQDFVDNQIQGGGAFNNCQIYKWVNRGTINVGDDLIINVEVHTIEGIKLPPAYHIITDRRPIYSYEYPIEDIPN